MGVIITPHESTNRLHEFQVREAGYLLTLIGKGEEPGGRNNDSEFIRMMRSTDGTGGKVDTGGAWCAVTRCHAGVVVASRLGLRVPYTPSRGARRLTKNIAKVGGWILEPGGDMQRKVTIPVGAAVCRKGRGWRGHFMTAVHHDPITDELTVIGGNRNNRMSPDGTWYAVIDVLSMSSKRWRRNLFGISALWTGGA